MNEALSAEWQLGKVERIRYDSKDGTPIEGWVVLPPEYGCGLEALSRGPSRLGITGYSYGGFLTNWAIGHTTRFRAGVVGAGPSDWISNYGTGDIPRTKETEFLGRPWEENARAVMLAHWPVLFADRIQTPMLFLHGEADARVQITQGEKCTRPLRNSEYVRSLYGIRGSITAVGRLGTWCIVTGKKWPGGGSIY